MVTNGTFIGDLAGLCYYVLVIIIIIQGDYKGKLKLELL